MQCHRETPPVYFVGAGPGDPKLLTLRAVEIIEAADLVLYTGSLVPAAVVARAKPGASVHDSAGLTLDQIIDTMVRTVQNGGMVARVHTGDPALFGSVAEQVRRLHAHGIATEIIPGVSSFLAAAAALGRELTLPELSQTVIISRAEGRTPVPPREKLALLAEHQATLVLFLSAALIRQVVDELTPAYGLTCPVAVVHKASWPDQQVIVGTLADVAQKLREAKIFAHSIIFVGQALNAEDFADSRLYDPTFAHRFRKASKSANQSV